MPYFIKNIENNTNEIKEEFDNELSISQIKTSYKDNASGPQNKLSIKQIKTSHKDSASGPKSVSPSPSPSISTSVLIDRVSTN